MNATEISALARQLFAAQGAKAIAEAARHADECRKGNDPERARDWERVEEVLRELRGPRQD